MKFSSTDNGVKGNSEWNIDFFDDFDSFNSDNWQDQRIWVNNEKQCYVPDNQYGTREVSEGTLKIKVINIGEKIECDNMDKHGNQHPETSYIAGRIASKKPKRICQREMDSSSANPGRKPSIYVSCLVDFGCSK